MSSLSTTDADVANSYNEWDPLKEAIVGCIEGAAVPQWEPSFEVDLTLQCRDFLQMYAGSPFPRELVEPAAKELEEFCRILTAEGITVRRPDCVDFSQPYSTPDFSASGLYAAMPRDILLAIGNEIIEAPMAWRCRFFEHRAYRSLMKDYLRRGAKWTTAPKPLMADELYDFDYLAKSPEEREKLALSRSKFAVTEYEPCFDAADVVRFGRDIFVQRSLTTNQLGILWLQRHLGDRFRVRTVSFEDSKPLHIDASLVPLRPGLALTCPIRPCHQAEWFKKAGWDLVEAAQPTLPNSWKMLFASRWLSMNILVLDPQRVVVEAQEEPLRKQLEDLGFETISIPFRHVYTFGGSFHCATCDVRREGQLEDYGFPSE